MLNKFKNIKPELFFVYAAIFFSIVFNLVTPPLQAPDEFNHFYKAYQLAEGKFLPNKVDNRLGGEIPNCVNKFVFPFENAATEWRLTLTKQDVLNGFTIKHNKDTVRFKDFPNTSYYSVVSYLPHTVAIFITKKLNCSVATMYYAGRLLTFLAWLICMFFVIKIVPVYKWLFTLICLLPMNIYITNSFSADTVSNILSFLFMALVLKHTFSENEFRLKNLIPLLIIIALLALAKVVYVGLVLAFLIIPIAKFKSKAQYFLCAAGLFLVAFIVTSYWSGVIMSHYTPYVDYNPAYRDWICLTHYSNYYQQKAYILSHGTYFLKVIYHSIFDHPYNFLQGYIGIFGYGDVFLPKWLIGLSYVVLIFVALFEKNNFRFTILQKTIMLGASFCAFVLLLLSQHLTWDAVGEGVVDEIQGRYLIPLFPFLFLALGNYKLNLNINYRIVFTLLLITLFSVSALQIIERYYIGTRIENNEITCDAETVTKDGLFTTSNPAVFLQGGAAKTDSVAHSGKSSLVLSEQTPYGFTFQFSNLSFGDVLEITVWQKGEGAQLVVASDGDNCEKQYYQSGSLYYYDETGWGRLYSKQLMTEKCKNATFKFYVWNPTKTKIYIDDLSFSIKKFRQ
jgi:uncharacterized membrane protein